jgi:hypothetical protein
MSACRLPLACVFPPHTRRRQASIDASTFFPDDLPQRGRDAVQYVHHSPFTNFGLISVPLAATPTPLRPIRA